MPLILAGQADFATLLTNLAPTGDAWPTEPGSVFQQALLALAGSFARLNARANNLVVDAFPKTTLELLTEWEESLGLPDPCAGPEPTIALRQRSVVAQLTARGGQSVPYFISIAAALGAAITVTQFTALRCDDGAADDPCNDDAWQFAWQVNMPPTVVTEMDCDNAYADDPLATWGSPVVECVLRRYAPEHCTLLFAYGGNLSTAALGDFQIGIDTLA